MSHHEMLVIFTDMSSSCASPLHGKNTDATLPNVAAAVKAEWLVIVELEAANVNYGEGCLTQRQSSSFIHQ